MEQIIKTKYGMAKINNRGYYVISTRKEGNHMKLLHRLVFEDYHDCKLDKNDVIHHIDNNPLNNHPTNLICMSKKAHGIIHNNGKTHSDKTKINMSKDRNTTGYLNVFKKKDKTCKQGFLWCYQYYEDGKRKAIMSVSVEKLEAKVRNKGLLWKNL